jgi:hypothetical protein
VSLHEISNDKGVTVNFTTSKNLTIKSKMFPYQDFTWASPDEKTHSQIHHILIDRRWHLTVTDV